MDLPVQIEQLVKEIIDISNKPYSFDLLSVLELYRIQFELTLANSILLEGVKTTQIAKHDRVIIKNIKEKVKPKKLPFFKCGKELKERVDY